MYGVSDLKRGLVIDLDGVPHMVETVKVSSPTARGANTITKVRLRNLRTKQKTDRSFRGGETFPVPDFARRDAQVLYREGDRVHFMDLVSYEQFHLDADDLGDQAGYLVDGLEGIVALWHGEELLGIELPPTVALEVADTPPAIKGGSATARTKPATLVTGLVVQVPEHLGAGEVIQVDTRDGSFLGRA